MKEYLAGQSTLGDFVLITTYLNRIAIPLSFLGSLYRILKESFANVDAMFELMNVENDVKEAPNASPLHCPHGHVRLDNVTFSYDPDREIISGLTIDIPAKSSIAFVGASGSGKSTISKLILRLYDISSGEITIDGVDIATVTQKSLRENIGVVAQDTILFNETIFNNIAY